VQQEEQLTERDLEVRAILHDAASPPAEPSFRERLKRDFAEGTLQERAFRPAPARRPKHMIRWAIGLAAAAAVVLAIGVLNEAPAWTALPSAGSGHLIVDGVAVPVSDTEELTRRIHPGARVRLDCVRDFDLVSSGVLAMQLSPGTEIVMPRPPGRWLGRASRASVAAGYLRLTTGKRFHGARLTIDAPDATVQVTGTTLAVIAEPKLTCICVLEGNVRVSYREAEGEKDSKEEEAEEREAEKSGPMVVTSGHRCTFLHGSAHPYMDEIRDTERPKLADLRDRMRSVMD